VVAVLFTTLKLALFAFTEVPVFDAIYRQFASDAALPPATVMAMSIGYRLFVILLPPALLALALLPPGSRKLSLGGRRAVIVMAFLLSYAAIEITQWAMRAPLVQLADSVR